MWSEHTENFITLTKVNTDDFYSLTVDIYEDMLTCQRSSCHPNFCLIQRSAMPMFPA